MKLAIALCLSSAAAFQAPAAAPASTALRAVDESTLGVQAPAGFLDPLGFVAKDGPEAFVRRRAVYFYNEILRRTIISFGTLFNGLTIKEILEKNNNSILDYVRFEVGEGIEKASEDFAEEVMKSISS